MEIIELCVGIIVVPTVPQGIDLGHGTGCLLDLAVGVIAVAGDHRSAAVDQIRHISLKVGNVVIGHRTGRAVGIGQRVGGSLGVVGEIQNFRCDSSVCGSCGNRLPQKPSPSVDVAVFLRNSRFQNTLTAAAGGGGLITQTILGNGRIRRINNADGRCVRVSATGAAVRGVFAVFRNHDIAMSQFGYYIVPIAVAAGTFVEGIAVLGTGGLCHGCRGIAVGVFRVSVAAAGAGIGNDRVGGILHIIVPQSRSFVRSVALATGALVEGIAALGAGGCGYRGDIIVNRNRLIGLGDHVFLRPAAVQIIGVRSGSCPLIQQENPTVSEGILKIRLSVLPLPPPRQEVLEDFELLDVFAHCVFRVAGQLDEAPSAVSITTP